MGGSVTYLGMVYFFYVTSLFLDLVIVVDFLRYPPRVESVDYERLVYYVRVTFVTLQLYHSPTSVACEDC